MENSTSKSFSEMAVNTTLERHLSEWQQLLNGPHGPNTDPNELRAIERQIDRVKTAINNNAPKFDPCLANDPVNVITDEGYNGLTKREYFAGKALTGLLMHPRWGEEQMDLISDMAVEQADSLIIALNE